MTHPFEYVDIKRSQLFLVAVLTTGTVVTSCVSDQRTVGITVVDSAGVSIVTIGALDTTPGYRWPFATEPTLRIGVVEGDSVYQLFNVTDAYRRRDGSIVVANAGSGETRFYDEDGRYIRGVGGEGEGPGEDGFLAWARPYRGDSIVSLDGATTRITISDAEGRYGRSFRPVAPGDRPRARVVAAFDDGFFLARYGERPATPQDSTRVERPTIRYGVWTPDGEFVSAFGVFMGGDQFIRADGRSVSAGELPFGRKTTISILGDHVIVADSTAREIALYKRNGRLGRIIRAPWTRHSLSARDVKVHRQQRLAAIEPSFFAEQRRRTIEATPYPELLPYYGTVVADTDRNIWVQDPPIPGRGFDRWLGFSEDGTYAGWIAIPRSLRVTHVNSNAVVGVAVDDVGVQYVEVYEIERPQ